MGKKRGRYSAEGQTHAALIFTMRKAIAEQATLVRKAIQKGGIDI